MKKIISRILQFIRNNKAAFDETAKFSGFFRNFM